jgi:glycosyltransferase involved in cell wall biosynthesis
MVASRLLGIDFSMTLHGSDLLQHRTYLDVKLRHCAFCMTISEYNQRFILQRYPEIRTEKVLISRLGVEIPVRPMPPLPSGECTEPFRILTVGRLHAVKDHAFLVRACAGLRALDLAFECEIAGEGPERRRLEYLIREHRLVGRVRLLGHADREQLDALYSWADLIVLTSRSEGIPLVLMEAMARGKLVLAPNITGIPELVIAGQTGFLYQAGSMNDFLEQLSALCSRTTAQSESTKREPTMNVSPQRVAWIRHAARLQVQNNFNRENNLKHFGDLFLQRVMAPIEETSYESAVLQQI